MKIRKYLKFVFIIAVIFYGALFIIMRNHVKNISEFKQKNQKRIEQFYQEEIKDSSIVFLGNSITEAYNLKKFFGRPFLNRGIGGNTTAAVLYRLDEVLRIKPKKIILMIGVNDISRGISKDSIVRNYERILSIIKTKLPDTKVYAISILPKRDTYNFKRVLINAAYWITFIRPLDLNSIIRQTNIEIEKLVKKYNYTYFDFNSEFTDPSNNKCLNSDLAIDNVHLNDKGYLLLTRLLKDKLKF